MQKINAFIKYCLLHPLKSVAILAIVVGVSSCKRDIPKAELLNNYEVNNYSEAFKVFWRGINSHYLFWDQDHVNWDSMYRVYAPRFDSLDHRPNSDTSSNACFQFMADMTKDLKDGQYMLQIYGGGDFNFDGRMYKSYIGFAPKLFRTQQLRDPLPDTLFDYIVQNNYLKNFDYGVYHNWNTNTVFQIITGTISKGNKNVLYTSLNLFGMKDAYSADYTARPPRPVIKNLFDKIHKSSCDAIIIDLRNNRGGNLEDINFLVGQFTASPTVFGYARYKSGEGRLDYTPLLPMSVEPQNGATDFKKPIIILTDMYTASLSETVVQAFKALPSATVITVGERTYGSCGLMGGNELSTNGGSFDIGPFGSVRLSTTAMMDKDRHFNFTGIAPDIEVKYNNSGVQQMLRSGVDIQLEKAIQYINK